MRALRVVIAGVCVLVLVATATALAGTVTTGGGAITYNADPATAADERVDVGIENGQAFVTSERGVTGSGCTQTDPNRVDCPPQPRFIVNFLGYNDNLGTDAVTGSVTLEVHGGGGDDNVSGTPNADTLIGDSGGDTLDGRAGNDVIDGGPGDDYLTDGAGDDAVSGGANNDSFTPGGGRDAYSGGEGGDSIDYRDRTAPVTMTADGNADDGEAGEGDNVGADIESLFGGSGPDRIVSGANANTLRGGSGNDRITAGSGEQRVEGDEGDDVIDTRDGVYDSIDCGPGTDTLLADPVTFQSNCEIAPDRDGDGTLNEADCAPDDPAVHPGGSEIFGNGVDEDCKNGPGYFKVGAGFDVRAAPKTRPARVRLTILRVTALRKGDRVEVRCSGKSCPFKKKTRTAGSKSSISLASLFKQRYLRAGTVVEIRVLRAKFVGKVLRLQITKAAGIKKTPSCITVGATKPGFCPLEG